MTKDNKIQQQLAHIAYNVDISISVAKTCLEVTLDVLNDAENDDIGRYTAILQCAESLSRRVDELRDFRVERNALEFALKAMGEMPQDGGDE